MLIGAVGQIGTPGYVLVRFLHQGDPDTPVEPVKSVEPVDQGSVQEVAWLEALASAANYVNTVRFQKLDAVETESSSNSYNVDRKNRIEHTYRQTNDRVTRQPSYQQTGQDGVSDEKETTPSDAGSETDSYEQTLNRLVDIIHKHVSDATLFGNLSAQQIEILSQLQDQITDTLNHAADEFSRSGSTRPIAFLDHLQDAVDRTSRYMQTGVDRGSIEAHSAQAIKLALDTEPTSLETLRQAFDSEVARLRKALDSGTTEPAQGRKPTRTVRPGQRLRAYRDFPANTSISSEGPIQLNAVA
ncbi:MAG: hypothetical protein JXA82_07415 [Sedimentisphaerales bacterium]|nr:hypothetical protein [Sedimentisphaerales bacterium]